jgi:cyclopropane-fatty-acyl-phospholipid synthase
MSVPRLRLAPERVLRQEPKARGSVLQFAAVAVLERVLPSLEGGMLVIELPDGTSRSFGSGTAVGMTITSHKLFRRLATRGKLGLGESYTAGEWRADDLVALFELLLRNSDVAAATHPRIRRLVTARPRLNRRTGLFAARRNIQYHYDLGNELFRLFLDETMTYSAAVFEHVGEPLEQAQERKLRLVCDKLRLGPDDHLLEIGCGWGSLALTAAGEYGARVTAATISPSQAALARERVAAAGLSSRIDVVERDYRELAGQFTKIASIEMLEAIGEKQFGLFFSTCDRLLAPNGLACIQTILVPDGRFPRYRATPDWIERYVFPGCLIPSVSALTAAMQRSSRLGVYALEEIGPHYAETLRRWRARFRANIGAVRGLGYDERFERTWDFYLAYCEAAFRTRSLRDAQLVLARPFETA